MGVIRELPPEVINQIAAGEVVERPASVVKELLENAIDAGASRVELTVERGGKDQVRVADDGKGIALDDLVLAFTPHATSKLVEADDLFRIATLGFRGEALAAIAEISRVTCQSRTADAAHGSELTITGGVKGPVKACGGPVGSIMEVRNLFFNTPVRRTFLKSDSTEAGHVAEMFMRVALARPDVRMTYRSSGKLIYDLPAGGSLKERIAAFFGRELADSLLWVEGRVGEIRLEGYVGHPSHSRSSAKCQFLFVGQRYVRDRSLAHALSEAYRGLLMVGRSPIAFLFLDLPPDQVDVNVHPTKIEVRFRDSNIIYSHVLGTIRKTFLTSDLHARLQAPPDDEAQAPTAQAPPRPVPEFWEFDAPPSSSASTSTWGPSEATPHAPASEAATPPDREAVAAWFPSADRPAEPVLHSPPAQASSRLWTEPAAPPPSETAPRDVPAPARAASNARALQIHDSYLVAETSEGLVVIDQHALHERILFEDFKRRLDQGGVESQRLLVPEPVDLPAPDVSALLEHREVLGRLGLEVEDFGGNTVLIHGLPAMLKHVETQELVRDLADHLRAHDLPPTPEGVLNGVLSMMACKAAVKANQRLGPEEIAALLERKDLVTNSHHCPHGRPSALVFTKMDLEKQFGRI